MVPPKNHKFHYLRQLPDLIRTTAACIGVDPNFIRIRIRLSRFVKIDTVERIPSVILARIPLVYVPLVYVSAPIGSDSHVYDIEFVASDLLRIGKPLSGVLWNESILWITMTFYHDVRSQHDIDDIIAMDLL